MSTHYAVKCGGKRYFLCFENGSPQFSSQPYPFCLERAEQIAKTIEGSVLVPYQTTPYEKLIRKVLGKTKF